MQLTGCAALWVILTASAGARADRDVHGGLNLRSDLATHQVRLELGARWRSLEAAVVLDPMSATDGQADHDAVATWWWSRERFGWFTGWRTSAYAIVGDDVWHHKLLTGVVARLPSIGTDRVRLIAGLELCAEVVRHGDAIATEWFDYSSGRAFGDLVNFSLFARAELALGF